MGELIIAILVIISFLYLIHLIDGRGKPKNIKQSNNGKLNNIKPKLPKTTWNPMKWEKYTLLITSAQKKFTDIYNFEVPKEFKEVGYIGLLANTILFEEARLSKLSPDDFEKLLVGLGGKEPFYTLIKPVGNDYFDFEAFRNMYMFYIDFRAREFRPIVSMMGVMQRLENNTVTLDDLKEMSKEYEIKPTFGRSV